MSEALTAEDPRYHVIFDAAAEARLNGEVVGDLTPAMNALRGEARVQKGALRELLGLREEPMGSVPRQSYTLFSFESCERAFRDNVIFSSALYREMPLVQALGDTILWKVGNDHKRYRAMAQPMFIEPKAMKWWRENWIDDIVDTLLDNLNGKDRADLNIDLCARVPVHVVTRGIGLDADKALDFREHLLRATMSRSATIEEKTVSMGEVVRMLNELIQDRRRNPADDVISGLIKRDLQTPDGRTREMTDEEIFSYCRVIMFAGGGTTWRQLGITLCALLKNGYWDACLNDRSLVPNAVHESLRWLPTDPVFPRLVTQDVEVEGVLIPEGSRVEICLGAANRDPTRWADRPDVYDVFRPYEYNLAVGIGPHQCLGQHVARQEMLVAINGLLDRFPKLRGDPDRPDPEVIGGLEARGMSAVPVLLH